MTKPKPPRQLQRRGRKPGPDRVGATWVAVEVRRKVGTVGRARGSVSRAIEFLAQDMADAYGEEFKIKTLQNRYYRAAVQRNSDPEYAAKLDRWKAREVEQCQPRDLGDGLAVEVVRWLPPSGPKKVRN